MSEYSRGEAGYPIGENFSIKYYILSVHYDNPQLIASIIILYQNSKIILFSLR